ncbi:MAG: efflux RND transporter periplasmic adaptor subunit [Hyphomonadaceae bacterium]|nr:efflux RND transporter periplasmic adaptor subunit [Hyphomonadaceae bacterium]
MAKLIKRILAIAIVGAIAAAVIYASVLPNTQRQADIARRAKLMGGGPVPVLAAPTRIADVPLYLDGVGTAKARNTVVVRPQVDGRILSINFKEGQEVKRGDVLAKIDPSTYQAQFDQAIAKKALDEAQLANAQRDMERYAKLGGNIVAQKTIDTQRALVDQLTAQIKLDDAAIANAKAFLDYTTIIAPINGRTGIRLVDEGNLVRASDAGIVIITELRPISVLFTLPQQQLVQVNKALAAGALAVEALDADGGLILDHGTLQVVDNQVDQSTGTVRMKAEFPNADLQLWPGQFVNVRLLVDTLQQVVVVPTPAVQRGPNGTFVYVLKKGEEDRVNLRPVTVTHQTEANAVIAKGLDSTERVVTTGFGRLKDGAEVAVATPKEQETAAAARQVATAARREDARANVRAACAADIQRLCANVERGKDMRACLQANAAALSEACKTAATGGGTRKNEVRKVEGSATE